MKFLLPFLAICVAFSSCSNSNKNARSIIDFNEDWKFTLADEPDAKAILFDDTDWQSIKVPHDWSIEEGYKNVEGTAASTGFVPGGIAWYRKSFILPASDEGKQITVLFDGVYNNSTVWINGQLLGHRPNGYASFSYDLSKHLKYGGEKNVIAVKVDRTAYVDSRWYTGSGIYRKVRLIKKSPLHIAQWGVQISTPEITKDNATISIKTTLENSGNKLPEALSIHYSIIDPQGVIIAGKEEDLETDAISNSTQIKLEKPLLWGLDRPQQYKLIVELKDGIEVLDNVKENFGIRYFAFDANTGFSLNGENMKLKGVNLHHDAGAVGAAVPKALWEYRVSKLKSIGVNAIRFAHNPHSKELLEVCDELGILVMNEAFDEWDRPKEKGVVYMGDGAGTPEAVRAYPESFNEWAERDLKDLILRDYNHPSVFMWSIGNEIEWIYPYYDETYQEVNPGITYYEDRPVYDSLTIKKVLDKKSGGADTLVMFARKLSGWVRDLDDTRPVVCGSVHPSVALASGYASNVDVLGFNYRAVEYDAAHEYYPDLNILGSENWGTYQEWKDCENRDFVAGIFCWTGFAYMGEAGPWPRKGLNISFFDYAGFKTPRGHFYECLWKEEPKVYAVTTPANESEFSYSEKEGWTFDMQMTPPPVWNLLRLWEWYKAYPKWKYGEGESIIVQTYTNCEEAELFLNGKSLGKQSRSAFAEDNIIKWLVPYTDGDLKVVGYNKGEKSAEYLLSTPGVLKTIQLDSHKSKLTSDGYDLTVITASLRDAKGSLITDVNTQINFEIEGECTNLGVDNGWERNVQPHKSNSIVTHNGQAIIIIQSLKEDGLISVKANAGSIRSNVCTIEVL